MKPVFVLFRASEQNLTGPDKPSDYAPFVAYRLLVTIGDEPEVEKDADGVIVQKKYDSSTHKSFCLTSGDGTDLSVFVRGLRDLADKLEDFGYVEWDRK